MKTFANGRGSRLCRKQLRIVVDLSIDSSLGDFTRSNSR
jgi:hypothetical protein